jgi:hypothetical protein
MPLNPNTPACLSCLPASLARTHSAHPAASFLILAFPPFPALLFRRAFPYAALPYASSSHLSRRSLSFRFAPCRCRATSRVRVYLPACLLLPSSTPQSPNPPMITSLPPAAASIVSPVRLSLLAGELHRYSPRAVQSGRSCCCYAVCVQCVFSGFDLFEVRFRRRRGRAR